MSQTTQNERRDSSTPAGDPHPPHHVSGWKVLLVVLLLGAALGGLWYSGYKPRQAREQAAASAANEQQTDLPVVTAARARPAAPEAEILLPGNISATAEASIYARAPGYVRTRKVDIGDRVREHQLLAEIDTPELDQQVAQARASVAQARQQLAQTRAAVLQAEAQRDYAKLTSDRYAALVARGAVSRQEADQQLASFKTTDALVNAQQAVVAAAQETITQAQANLDRVTVLQDYQNVRAPMAGIVTARNIEVGYLISSNGGGLGASPASVSGANTLTGNEMFRIAQIGTVRIVASVPQTVAPSIAIGMPADVTVVEFPGRVFNGKVTRTTNVLDPASRTMQTQIDIPNRDGKLLPGMYAQVHFKYHRATPPPIVPGDAIMTGAAGPQVAVLLPPGAQGARRIHIVSVQIGRDYGAETEIIEGLTGQETVVVNPGDAVREGALVKAELRAAGRGGAEGRGGRGAPAGRGGRGPQSTNQPPGRGAAPGRGRAGQATGAETK